MNTKTGNVLTLISPNTQASGDFGASVAISGSTVVVGAPFETSFGKANAGNSYTFKASTGALLKVLSSPNPESNGFFGDAVAVSGNSIVVGAPHETVSSNINAGHVYVFNAQNSLVKLLVSPSPLSGAQFGHSVAVGGNTIVVGAPFDTGAGVTGSGAAYTFNAVTGNSISTLLESQCYWERRVRVECGDKRQLRSCGCSK